jgi:23S rRNA (uracil1939-C5)-methyltransferase
VATEAEVVSLVSCDAGSLGRDAGLLTAAGYRLDRITLVDLFPQTHHVEAVTRYVRA